MLKFKTIWGRIRYRLDTELLPGSGTLKKRKGIQNKSFRIHSTACLCWMFRYLLGPLGQLNITAKDLQGNNKT